MSTDPPVVRDLDDLTVPWLEGVLGTGPIAGFSCAPIGTGQMSQSHRVVLDYAGADTAGPPSVVVKIAATDPTSRATGVGLGAYEREIRFYRELAPRIGGPLPACHAALIDPSEGWFTLVLEDAAPAVQGDQIAGCTVAQARAGDAGAGAASTHLSSPTRSSARPRGSIRRCRSTRRS